MFFFVCLEWVLLWGGSATKDSRNSRSGGMEPLDSWSLFTRAIDLPGSSDLCSVLFLLLFLGVCLLVWVCFPLHCPRNHKPCSSQLFCYQNEFWIQMKVGICHVLLHLTRFSRVSVLGPADFQGGWHSWPLVSSGVVFWSSASRSR